MISVFLGFLTFLISGGFLLPQVTSIELPPEYALLAPAGLIVLAMFIQIDVLMLLKKMNLYKNQAQKAEKDQAGLKAAQEELQALKKEFSQEKEQRQEFAERLKSSQTKILELESANKEKEKERGEQVAKLKTALSVENKKYAEISEKLSQFQKEQSGDLGAVTLLNVLQEKGRFIDFLMDDVTSYSDQDIGAASRLVHQGCQKAVHECFDIKPIWPDEEGSPTKVDEQSNPLTYKLIGQIKGSGPVSGTVVHRGWQTEKIKLPQLNNPSQQDPVMKKLIAPAEIEI